MKKVIGGILVVALLAGGFLLWDRTRPKPPVYKPVLGALSLPHCPSCEKKLVPYTDCGECGRKILWTSEEKAKEILDDAGKAIDRTVEDLKK
ncbi:MAG: hypothetical protein ACYTGH_16570 [Planctomycetota bacterium]|jgi:hypothetical protein